MSNIAEAFGAFVPTLRLPAAVCPVPLQSTPHNTLPKFNWFEPVYTAGKAL
jgi:hypothetical protein